MKKGALIILLFLLLPSAFAEMKVTSEQPVYNLGNKIKALVSVMPESSFEGFFRAAISCGDYRIDYFLTPLTLESNFRTAVEVPMLAVTSQMIGECIIIAELVTDSDGITDQSPSNVFTVTDKLNVLPLDPKAEAFPSDTVKVAAVVNEANGNNILKGNAKITLDGAESGAEITDGRFDTSLLLPGNIKSGLHSIEIEASDAKGNNGDALTELYITAVPSYISNGISGDSIIPGTRINITSSLYDQANDIINVSIDLELMGPSKENIFKKIVQSNERIDYEFSQYAAPGSYLLKGSYRNIVAESYINISSVRQAKINYGNENVFIENIGNVPFVEDLTIFLRSGIKKYPLSKSINLAPGESMSFDLSREVPSGIYDVAMNIKKGLEPVTGNVMQVIQNIVQSQNGNTSELAQTENVLANGVEIHDNRPAYKKIGSSLSSISGNLIGADGLLSKNGWLAPLVLIGVLLLVVIRYGRKPLFHMFKKDKEEKEKEN